MRPGLSGQVADGDSGRRYAFHGQLLDALGCLGEQLVFARKERIDLAMRLFEVPSLGDKLGDQFLV
jgi:hypothetical protein